MDLLNVTNRAQIHEFYKKFLFLKLEFSNYVANGLHRKLWTIQNFSSISLKLCLLHQIKHRDMGVNSNKRINIKTL